MSSKLSKSDLKEIVKECLVEILQEGIMSSSGGKPAARQRIRENNTKSRRSSFDHVSWARDNTDKNKSIDYTQQAKSLTDNPILAEVLADSHKTLNDQMQAERMGVSAMAGDHADRTVATSDPADLFGAASNNWAALAFGGE